MSDPLLSIVVCTYNRADGLAKALAGIDRLESDRLDWDAIIVDNGSRDSSLKLAREWAAADPARRRVVIEPVPGLSRARNRGWRASAARFVAYLDDDAIPRSGWYRALADEISRDDGRTGIIGGKIEPIWEVPRPAWLSDRMVPFLSMLDYGEARRALGEDENVVGANMAIARTALEQAGGFNEQLGRRGRRLVSNEEAALQHRLTSLGWRAIYRPDMIVRHHAPAERIQVGWFRRRFFWQGYSDRITQRSHQIPGESLRQTFRLAARYARRAYQAPTGSPERLDATMDVAYYLGVAYGTIAARGRS
ncbi:glycosyltransferase [Sphingomonas sp.]|uniref:glycosyltransferase n=1 Tax=Sphingomonas sp. TaxID=28214 RepID=UPI0025D1C395|nr:glycosyltransferase [Sphingomonas sp.]